ncbi:hypothetical protein RRF57_002752 [Xylaria bambusicola]|uniref:Uncharacterized protein n=1 Tax=Xylaria bambusicola TaxID=326684 RepID=A0AAN7Z2R6_9PEZI
MGRGFTLLLKIQGPSAPCHQERQRKTVGKGRVRSWLTHTSRCSVTMKSRFGVDPWPGPARSLPFGVWQGVEMNLGFAFNDATNPRSIMQLGSRVSWRSVAIRNNKQCAGCYAENWSWWAIPASQAGGTTGESPFSQARFSCVHCDCDPVLIAGVLLLEENTAREDWNS